MIKVGDFAIFGTVDVDGAWLQAAWNIGELGFLIFYDEGGDDVAQIMIWHVLVGDKENIIWI